MIWYVRWYDMMIWYGGNGARLPPRLTPSRLSFSLSDRRNRCFYNILAGSQTPTELTELTEQTITLANYLDGLFLFHFFYGSF